MIDIHIETTATRSPGPIVQMDCPSCGAKDVATATAGVISEERIFGLFSATKTHWTEVQCSACHRIFRSPVSTDTLGRMTAAEITQAISSYGMAYVGNITKFCIVMSILFGVIGPFGLAMAIVGLIGTRKSRTLWKPAAYVGLTISVVCSILLFWSVANERR